MELGSIGGLRPLQGTGTAVVEDFNQMRIEGGGGIFGSKNRDMTEKGKCRKQSDGRGNNGRKGTKVMKRVIQYFYNGLTAVAFKIGRKYFFMLILKCRDKLINIDKLEKYQDNLFKTFLVVTFKK